MGQGSLFGGWEATRLEISLGFHPNQHSGWVHLGTLDENGRSLTHRSITWRNERDLSGVPDMLKVVGAAWLYGTPEDVIHEGMKAVAQHLPEVKLRA
jgi:hypothetical protein